MEVEKVNRDKKNALMRQQIIRSAMEEFGLNSYAEASLNAICKNGKISKGIIYHYFKDKDELYLGCVAECFQQFTVFLKETHFSFETVEQGIEKLLERRHQFFADHPAQNMIFTNALLQPPKHLAEEIKGIKEGLDTFNAQFYERIMDLVELKDGVSREEAMEFFLIFQESFNFYFQRKTYGNFQELFDEHELKLSKFLNVMLYGIAKEDTKD